jgi:hypothetical protein
MAAVGQPHDDPVAREDPLGTNGGRPQPQVLAFRPPPSESAHFPKKLRQREAILSNLYSGAILRTVFGLRQFGTMPTGRASPNSRGVARRVCVQRRKLPALHEDCVTYVELLRAKDGQESTASSHHRLCLRSTEQALVPGWPRQENCQTNPMTLGHKT